MEVLERVLYHYPRYTVEDLLDMPFTLLKMLANRAQYRQDKEMAHVRLSGLFTASALFGGKA